jgi:hypothetical protein
MGEIITQNLDVFHLEFEDIPHTGDYHGS